MLALKRCFVHLSYNIFSFIFRLWNVIISIFLGTKFVGFHAYVIR